MEFKCNHPEIVVSTLKGFKRLKNYELRNLFNCFSDEMFKNLEVQKVIAHKYPLYIYVSKSLCQNVKMIEKAIGSNGKAIKFISNELLKKNQHLVLTAVKNNRKSLYYVMTLLKYSTIWKNPIIREAAFKCFTKRLLCHTISYYYEIEMRRIFREEYERAVNFMGDSYRDPLLYDSNGRRMRVVYLEEVVEFFEEEESNHSS